MLALCLSQIRFRTAMRPHVTLQARDTSCWMPMTRQLTATLLCACELVGHMILSWWHVPVHLQAFLQLTPQPLPPQTCQAEAIMCVHAHETLHAAFIISGESALVPKVVRTGFSRRSIMSRALCFLRGAQQGMVKVRACPIDPAVLCLATRPL